MIKKIFSLILALILCISTLLIAFAAKPVTLTIVGGEAFAGENFEVQVKVSDNSKIAGAVIEVHYDTNKLQYVDSKAGGILDSNGQVSIKNSKNGVVTFVYLSTDSEIYAEGILMSIKFRVLDDAEGVADISLKIPNSADFIDINTNKLKYELKNAKIDISNNNVTQNDTETTEETVEITEPTTETSEKVSDDVLEELSSQNDENKENSKNNKSVILLVSVILIAVLLVILIILAISKKRKGEE